MSNIRFPVAINVQGNIRNCNQLYSDIVELWLDKFVHTIRFMYVVNKVRGTKQMDMCAAIAMGD